MKKSEFDVSGVFDADGGKRVKINAIYDDDVMSLHVGSYRDFKWFAHEKCVSKERDVEIPLSISRFNGMDNEDNRFIGKLELRFSSRNNDILTPLSYYIDVIIHVMDLKTKQTHIIGGLATIYRLLHNAKYNMMEKVDIEQSSSVIVQRTVSTESINQILTLNGISMKYVDTNDAGNEKFDIRNYTKPMTISHAICKQFKLLVKGNMSSVIGIFYLLSVAFFAVIASMTIIKVVFNWIDLANIMEQYLGFPEKVSHITCYGINVYISIIIVSHVLRGSPIIKIINETFAPYWEEQISNANEVLNEIYEFENYPYQSYRAYEFIDIKRSNEHQIVLDFKHMGQVFETISAREEAIILDYQHLNVDPRKLAMINHVSSDRITSDKIGKIEALIKNYHNTSNKLRYQKEVEKYDKLYTSHSEKGQTKFQDSLSEVENELKKYERELQNILNRKTT